MILSPRDGFSTDVVVTVKNQDPSVAERLNVRIEFDQHAGGFTTSRPRDGCFVQGGTREPPWLLCVHPSLAVTGATTRER